MGGIKKKMCGNLREKKRMRKRLLRSRTEMFLKKCQKTYSKRDGKGCVRVNRLENETKPLFPTTISIVNDLLPWCLVPEIQTGNHVSAVILVGIEYLVHKVRK